jgi:hypothetical protein
MRGLPHERTLSALTAMKEPDDDWRGLTIFEDPQDQRGPIREIGLAPRRPTLSGGGAGRVGRA